MVIFWIRLCHDSDIKCWYMIHSYIYFLLSSPDIRSFKWDVKRLKSEKKNQGLWLQTKQWVFQVIFLFTLIFVHLLSCRLFNELTWKIIIDFYFEILWRRGQISCFNENPTHVEVPIFYSVWVCVKYLYEDKKSCRCIH